MPAASKDIYRLFHPHASERAEGVNRFAYYTRAETALSVIQNETLWLRKTTCMNDYRELTFGWECLATQLTTKAEVFRKALEPVFPGLADEVSARFLSTGQKMLDQTYIACVSEHQDSEDRLGRLSMWRAYGGTTGVAIIFKKEAAMLAGLPYYASPVLYATAQDFEYQFERVMQGLSLSGDILRSIGRPGVFDELLFALISAFTSTKHIGFQEEREWRIIYQPQDAYEKMMPPFVKTINGVPQVVHEISLSRAGLPFSLLNFIEQIIVGPTQFPNEIAEALRAELKYKGALETSVVVSEIPLRYNV